MRENQEFPVDFVGTFLHQIWIRNNSLKKNRKKSDRLELRLSELDRLFPLYIFPL